MSNGLCFDDPQLLLQTNSCIYPVSKDLEGKLTHQQSDPEKCADPKCVTLRTLHLVELDAVTFACDSPEGKSLDGKIIIPNFSTVFDVDDHHRGVHAGDFDWHPAAGGVVRGRVSGLTNAGPFRGPVFPSCEQCDSLGNLLGRLCGQIMEAPSTAPDLKGCWVTAIYRIGFDPSQAGEGSVRGTIEGVLICKCGD